MPAHSFNAVIFAGGPNPGPFEFRIDDVRLRWEPRMKGQHVQQRDRGAYGRGLLGALAMCFSLGVASAIGDTARVRFGLEGIAPQLLQAGACSALAVPLIVLLRRRVDGLSMEGLGLPKLRTGLRTFGLGILVTGGAATTTFALGAALDWVQLGAVSWSAAFSFLAVNTAIAFLYEALPEELTLRGYTYRSLNAALRRWTASLCTIALFLVMPVGASATQVAVARAIGGPVQALTFAPRGEDPLAYLILLTVFGATLLIARITTGSLWTAIALHLTFLTVNRLVLAGQEVTGWSVVLATPDAILLIPAYLLLAAASFLALARWQGRRIGWRDRDPEPEPAAESATIAVSISR